MEIRFDLNVEGATVSISPCCDATRWEGPNESE